MASLDDYDEFGNYIGADLDSDDDEDEGLHHDYSGPSQTQAAPLQGYDEDAMPGQEDGALMEIDGAQTERRSDDILLTRLSRALA
jgi:116 kDa U5 small nuclear ribonucleoprotein component